MTFAGLLGTGRVYQYQRDEWHQIVEASACASLAAIVFFIVNGSIDWPSGMAVLFGTLVGGYYSAKVSRRIPQQYVHFW
ncbi:sulfite exporter TauE/SafE family protein [Vibrio lentus]|nr:sulfite exporter TauE/SafE family protein [Vibrio lentus]